MKKSKTGIRGNKMKKARYILIVTSTLAGIMLSTGCNLTNQNDVRGTWIFTGHYNGIEFNKILTFSGKKTRGTVTDELDGIAAYTSDGYNVKFDLSIICFCKKNWNGYFIDKDYMEGNLNGCSSGIWTASRF
ncbi:MAG: hypothetical protein JSV09_02315 [Thermoplasmata archaeon]|nr:MAG: hypothetical protein JSV09_02315 [Thermoplasmata archaeon]